MRALKAMCDVLKNMWLVTHKTRFVWYSWTLQRFDVALQKSTCRLHVRCGMFCNLKCVTNANIITGTELDSYLTCTTFRWLGLKSWSNTRLKKLRIEGIHNLYPSPICIRMIKSRGMIWGWEGMWHIRGKREIHTLLVDKSEGKRPF